MKEEVVHFSNEAAMKERQLEGERRRGAELQEVVVLQERRLGQQVGELGELRRRLDTSTRCQAGGALGVTYLQGLQPVTAPLRGERRGCRHPWGPHLPAGYGGR